VWLTVGLTSLARRLPLPAATQKVVVTVPAGVACGELFAVEHDGQLFEVVVPPGLVAGDELELELPAQPSPSAPPRPPPPPSAAQGGVGWDDWDGAWEPTPRGASDDWSEAPAAAPYYGRYKLGETVQVQRSSGDWSPATIKEYDEVSDTYTIELVVIRLLKYMVRGPPSLR
jgi:hypothetical protein